jgi:hypothetical protein
MDDASLTDIPKPQLPPLAPVAALLIGVPMLLGSVASALAVF